MNRRVAAVAGAGCAALVVAVGMPSFSTAAFTSRSQATGSVAAAKDWTPPTVSVRNPGAAVQGTATVVADASDAESGIREVVLEYRQAGSATWAPLCTDATAPYECTWDTTKLADDSYALRAVATDNSGYTATSAAVTTRVSNRVTVSIDAPGDAVAVRGTVPVPVTVTGSGAYTVRVEYAPAGSTSFRVLCTDGTAPYGCSWNTTQHANQEYDLRAVATLGGLSYGSETVADVLVDNAAPTVTMRDPGSPLRGAVTFAADAADSHSGVATVTVQYAAAGGTYRDLCTLEDEPFTCTYRTPQLADGTYSFRAVATDAAGNTTTSAAVTGRVVDNSVPTVSLDDPGAVLRGKVALTAHPKSSAAVTSVRIQRAATGTTSWTDICADTTAPYTCTWDTASVADASYDLRAVMADALNRTTTSPVVTGRRVDNSPFRGVDVQATNGSGKAGRLDSGDTVTYTFSQQVAPASLSSGWEGGPVAVTLRLRDGWLVGSTSKGDLLDVQRGKAAVNLGSVTLNENHIALLGTATFNATMSLRSTTVDGVPATTVTLTVGSQASGTIRGAGGAAAMVWRPSTLVTDLSGRSCSATPVTESGAKDRDF